MEDKHAEPEPVLLLYLSKILLKESRDFAQCFFCSGSDCLARYGQVPAVYK
jgi:hypothetical protein